MKQAMTSVDVAAVAAELSPLLVGGRFDKAYQPAKDQVLLRVRRKGAGRTDLLFQLGKFLTATKRAPENPDKPSMVAQLLRTTLENARVVGFQQIGFDRLLRMDLERGDGARSLVFELFGDGNLLLLAGDGTIELPMIGVDHGARRLRKGEPYVPPPGGVLPFALDVDALRAAAAGQKDLVRFLATRLGFGPLWAEELCLRASLAKDLAAEALSAKDWTALHEVIASLGRDIARNDLAPAVVYEDGKAVDAVPFVMQRYPAPRFSHEETPTFREALDTLWVGSAGEEGEEDSDDPRRVRFDEARGKLLRQVEQMEQAIAAFVAEEADLQADGDALFASFAEVQATLDTLQAARREHGWNEVDEILRKARAAGKAEAMRVPAIQPHSGHATLIVRDPAGRDREVEVDLRLTVQANADAFFAAAKKSRSRREGAERAREEALARLRDLEKKGLDGFGAAPTRKEHASRHFWFESYRWSVTPGGLIAVGGRNAPQNDAVVKKYLRDGDRYVHADAHGAPSVVLRPADGPPLADYSAEDLRAACQFAACGSRAWRQGGSASAYWVTPAQVSKTPRAGEYVPRGAWIIHGRRNVETDLPLEWAVGRVGFESDGTPVAAGSTARYEKLVGGPPQSLQRFATDLLLMVPGEMGIDEASARIAQRFNATHEEAQGVLPAGSVRFIEVGGAAPRARPEVPR